MALFKIACAAAVLCYIAPHLGSQIIETARPAFEPARLAVPAETSANAVMAYCQQHREACIRFARLAIEEVSSRNEAPQTETQRAETQRADVAGGFGLRSALPGIVPLPPVRPFFDKP
jgi:hypothetical protein